VRFIDTVHVQGGPKKFCDNFRKCTPILTIFSLLQQEMYDVWKYKKA